MTTTTAHRTDRAAPIYERHTCEAGPLCEQMTAWLAENDAIGELAADPMNDYAGFVPDLPEPTTAECGHWACLGMTHEDCRACYAEAMDEYERELAARAACPLTARFPRHLPGMLVGCTEARVTP
jgi:hypothetical protein